VNGSGESIGTGVIISSDGQIVTNNHVVEGSKTVRVRLAGETDARVADVLATDPGNDLGLIKLRNASGLTAATFADETSLAVGDAVVAIGYALDLDGAPSVTSGVISALNRTMITDNGALNALIQTDTPISSGNSGGPLINMSGQVVGINTAVARGDSSTAANNIGFAISVGEVKRVIGELRQRANGEKRTEGYLGIGLTDRSDAGQGAVIADVADDSPASKAGLKVGDVVLEINNQPVTGQGTVIAVVRDSAPGDQVMIKLKRDGRVLTVTATLIARPSN
jgi:putative serine protease PepD